MEPNSSNISFILFEEFLDLLRYHGFSIGVDTHLTLTQLLQKLGDNVSPERLKTLMAPLLAHNPQQQTEFYHLFDQYFSPYVDLSEPLTQLEKSPTKQETSPESLIDWLKYLSNQGGSFFFSRIRSPQSQAESDNTAGRPPKKSNQISGWLQLLSKRRFYLFVQIILLLFMGYWGIRGINCYQQTKDFERTLLCLQGISTPDPIVEAPESGVRSARAPLPPLPESLQDTSRSSWEKLSEQLDLNTSPPLEEDISDLSASWYEQYNPVIKLLLILLLVVGWIFFEIYLVNRKKLVLLQERNKRPPYIWPVRPQETSGNLYTEQEFYLASRKLRERESAPGEEVDLEKSIHETLDTGGYPKISYRQRTKPPEYLVLIQKFHKRDHRAMFFDQMILELQQQDLYIERYFYEQDPRLCWKEKYADTIYLEDLYRRHPDDRLIVIGDASSFFDPVKDDLCDWATSVKKWKQVALVSSASPLEWGHRELRLAKEFVFLPATTEAIGSVIDLLNQDIRPPLRYWLEANEYPTPPPEDAPEMIVRLQEYCDTRYEGGKRIYKRGSGKHLFTWLCACALYPELSWDLTYSYGKALEEGLGESIADSRNLLKLVRLPWFQEGFIPDELRESLIPLLKGKEEKIVRKTLIGILKNSPPPSGSYAETEYELLVAVLEAQLHGDFTHQLHLLRQVQEYSLVHEIQDQTILQYLKSLPKSVLKINVPTALSNRLFNQGVFSLGLKKGVRGLFVALLGTLILLSVNDSWLKIEKYKGERYYLANDEDRMRFHTYVGNMYLAEQSYPEAARSYEEALILRENSGAAEYLTPEYNLALLKWGLGKVDEARAEFAMISEQSEELITEPSLPEEAKEQLAQIQVESSYNQGVIAFRSQDLEEAETAFQRAAANDLTNSDAVYGQAMVFLKKALATQGADQGNKLVLALNKLQDVQELDSAYLQSHPDLGPVLDSLSLQDFSGLLGRRLEELRLNLGLIAELPPEPPTTSPDQSSTDSDLSVELDPQLLYMSDFRNGLAVVQYEGKYGFADQKKNLFGVRYEDARPFSNGLAAVKRDGKWGYVNENMEEEISPQYENANDFVQAWTSVKQDGLWGCINKRNEQKIPFAFEQAVRFEDSTQTPDGAIPLAAVVQDGKYFFIDKSGTDVFAPARFKWAENFSGHSGQYARVNRWGSDYYIDRSGACVPELLKDQDCPTEKWEKVLLRDLRSHKGQINAISISTNNRYIVTAGMDGQVIVWQSFGREQVAILNHESPVRSVAISSDNRYILTGADDGQVRLWSPDGSLLQAFPAANQRILTVAFSPNNLFAAAGSEDHTAYLYEVRTGELLREFKKHTQDVTSLAFSPDGNSIVSGSEDRTIRIWNLVGEELRKINARSQVLSVAYSQDGQQIVAGTKVGLVLAYSLSRTVNLPLLTLDQHRDWVWQVGFSRDGSYIFSSSADNTAKVWNRRKQTVMEVRRPGTVRAVTLSQDGKYVLIASWGGTGTGNNKVSIYKVEQY